MDKNEMKKKNNKKGDLMVIRRPTLAMRHPDFHFQNFFLFGSLDEKKIKSTGEVI